jgi:hypothetical protein
MNAAKTKRSGREILAIIRNIVIATYLRPHHRYVLWLDADVVRLWVGCTLALRDRSSSLSRTH